PATTRWSFCRPLARRSARTLSSSPAGTATTKLWIEGARSKPSAAWTSRGSPRSSRNCLAAPKRRPLPAAGRIPTTLIVGSRGCLELEDFLQIFLDLIFVAVLGEREFLDEQRACRIQHLALTEGQLLVRAEAVEIPEHLRDLEDRAGLDLLHV